MDVCQDEECPNYEKDELNKCNLFKQVGECPTPDYLNVKTEPVSEVPCSAGLSDVLDTGDLVNDPLYKALDKLYESGWVDKHKERDYDPRGTEEWQSVLDLFRLQQDR